MEKTREYSDLKLESVLENFEDVLYKKDSKLIGPQLYKFLTLYTGFIAHYNIHGFRAEYEDLRDLVGYLLREDAFGLVYHLSNPNSYLYDVKYNGVFVAEFVKGLLELARKYQDEVSQYFFEKENREKLAHLKALANELGYTITKGG